MTESAAETTAVEAACRDIDRYIAETSRPASHDKPVSPSERLRALGRQHAGSLQPPPAVGLMETPLFPDKP
ncbi:MAG: hypothetical protein WA776_13960 [Xanthobacteraceae bacterium]